VAAAELAAAELAAAKLAAAELAAAELAAAELAAAELARCRAEPERDRAPSFAQGSLLLTLLFRRFFKGKPSAEELAAQVLRGESRWSLPA
jgi:hypothetical protein